MLIYQYQKQFQLFSILYITTVVFICDRNVILNDFMRLIALQTKMFK